MIAIHLKTKLVEAFFSTPNPVSEERLGQEKTIFIEI